MPDQMPMALSEEIGTETGEVVSPRTAARTELGQIGGFVSFRGDDLIMAQPERRYRSMTNGGWRQEDPPSRALFG